MDKWTDRYNAMTIAYWLVAIGAKNLSAVMIVGVVTDFEMTFKCDLFKIA